MTLEKVHAVAALISTDQFEVPCIDSRILDLPRRYFGVILLELDVSC